MNLFNRLFPVGTRSLLFGVHQFLWHPWTVYRAWRYLYGKPTWREVVCIFLHDLGYFGKPNMDGEEGGGIRRLVLASWDDCSARSTANWFCITAGIMQSCRANCRANSVGRISCPSRSTPNGSICFVPGARGRSRSIVQTAVRSLR